MEDQGGPGSIHHVSGCEVDVRGGGADIYSNIYVLNLKASFLPVKTSSFYHAKVWTLKMREQMVLCVVLAVGPSPPTSTSRLPDVIHVMNALGPSPL